MRLPGFPPIRYPNVAYLRVHFLNLLVGAVVLRGGDVVLPHADGDVVDVPFP